ncbi:MAG: mucoidy inhibitor MuiA family protein [Verrucomicrobiales bacterium]|jgi:uncharacterized protein (TIGR02231 family)|nr:mucoidy inhibitor MuiA family protein [Verrucomicrobiales bacterium]
MRHFLSFVVLSASGIAACAASLTADSKISDVTVYQDRAIVTRSAEVKLADGEQQVVFAGLPDGLDENSVRARGTGSGFKILGVEIRRDFKKVADSEELKVLRDQVKALQFQTQDLDDERNMLSQKQNLLDRLSNKLGGDEKHPLTVTEIKGMTDYYGEQNATIKTRLRAIERSRDDLNRQIGDLNKQIATLAQPGSPDKRSVVVTVSAEAAVSAELQVDYLIHGCSWQPQYDVHYQTGEKNLALTVYGVIRQSSGEDWDGVKVTLSTARPQQGTSLPDLAKWTLNVSTPQPPASAMAPMKEGALSITGGTVRTWGGNEIRGNSFSAGSGGVVNYSGAISAGSLMVENQALFQTADVVTQGFSAVYKVPTTVSVPSDGQPHRCTISIMELAAEQSYASTPKLNPGAFVKAKVKNANAAPLLPGQLNVFMGNDFVGSARLALIGPEGVFDLFLGKDDTIKAQRQDKTRKEETSGVFTKSKIVKMGYTIELENFQSKDVTVSLKDQIPVSQNEKIKVTYKSNMKVSEENKETGELTWDLAIPAKKKVTVDVDFQVECPPDITVSGL